MATHYRHTHTMVTHYRRTLSLHAQSVDELRKATVAISRFLLEFFVEVGEGGEGGEARVMRPLPNSNFVIDFYRFRDAPYFATMTTYVSPYN